MAAGPARKKTAAAIHQEIAWEVNRLLARIFAQPRNSGGTDPEAIESALRVVLHRAGAGPLSELLQFEAPPPNRRTGVAVVNKEAEGRNGKTDGQPAHTR
jgi:hypothetical protein